MWDNKTAAIEIVKFALEEAMKSQMGREIQFYSFFNLGARWGGWLMPRRGRFAPGQEVWCQFCSRLGGPQDRFERVRKIAPTGISSPDLQPIASRSTDRAIPARTVDVQWSIFYSHNLLIHPYLLNNALRTDYKSKNVYFRNRFQNTEFPALAAGCLEYIRNYFTFKALLCFKKKLIFRVSTVGLRQNTKPMGCSVRRHISEHWKFCAVYLRSS